MTPLHHPSTYIGSRELPEPSEAMLALISRCRRLSVDEIFRSLPYFSAIVEKEGWACVEGIERAAAKVRADEQRACRVEADQHEADEHALRTFLTKAIGPDWEKQRDELVALGIIPGGKCSYPSLSMSERLPEHGALQEAPKLRVTRELQEILDRYLDQFGAPGREGRVPIEVIQSTYLAAAIEELEEMAKQAELTRIAAVEVGDVVGARRASGDVEAITMYPPHLRDVLEQVEAYEMGAE